MKKLSTLLFCCLLSFFSQAQYNNSFTFEDANYSHYIIIDSTTHAHNSWQIGKPQKTIFAAAYSNPNAIITDTLNPYPPNDTSVFILSMPFVKKAFGIYAPAYHLQFLYKLQKDTGDMAMLEVSQDSGAHWYNIKDSLPSEFLWTSSTHSIDTSTSWKTAQFTIQLTSPFLAADTAKSFLFRFTFISDTATTGKDGWMIDNFWETYYVEGIEALAANNNLVSVFPNPSAGSLYVQVNDKNAENGTVAIYDINGKQVYSAKKLPSDNKLELPLHNGIYTLRYTTATQYCIKQIVIDR